MNSVEVYAYHFWGTKRKYDPRLDIIEKKMEQIYSVQHRSFPGLDQSG